MKRLPSAKILFELYKIHTQTEIALMYGISSQSVSEKLIRYFPNYHKKKKSFKKNCLICNKKFIVYPYMIKRNKGKYCSRRCVNKSLIKSFVHLVCAGCGKNFKRLRYRLNKKGVNYCSHKCFMKNSNLIEKSMGKNHWNWKGGLGKSWRKRTPEYLIWREKIFSKYGRICHYCGSTNRLEVDHLWPYSLWPNLALNPNNGQILCHECHKKTFTYSLRNYKFLKLAREALGEDVIKKGVPPPEQIMQIRRQIKQDYNI